METKAKVWLYTGWHIFVDNALFIVPKVREMKRDNGRESREEK